MVNLDQAQKNVRNAQDQLDQALKELEKAKKPKTVEFVATFGGDFSAGQYINQRCIATDEAWPKLPDGPCKVTVRPLGGPEPVVFKACVAQDPYWPVTDDKGTVTVSGFGLAHLIGKVCRVTVEWVDE